MAQFHGQLNHNEHFATLFNFIINVQTFAKNIAKKGAPLVNMARVEGSQYGDTKVYVATDILRSYDWLDENNVANNNLLARDYAPDPETQTITINQFRQIALTLNPYLQKRAFKDEGSYADFTAVLSQWVSETKRVFEEKLFHSFIGTNKATGTLQNITLPAVEGDTAEETARLEAQTLAREIADLYVKLADASRDFNDLGNYRSFDKEDLVVVWNAEHVNKITKMDLPTIFNSEGLIDGFKYTLPGKYFGNIKTAGGTVPSGSANTTIRSLVEKDYNGDKSMKDPTYVKSLHIFPGDLIPAGQAYNAYEAYEEDAKVVCKIYHKDSVPLMSSFSVATSFFNPKSLEENRYLTWGYNTLESLDNFPFITISAAKA